MNKSKYSEFQKLTRQMAKLAAKEGAVAIVAGPKWVKFMIPGKLKGELLPRNWVKFLAMAEKLSGGAK